MEENCVFIYFIVGGVGVRENGEGIVEIVKREGDRVLIKRRD